MRCFRVDEGSVAGIHLSAVEGGLCIEVGDKFLPIDRRLSESLTSTRYSIIGKLNECLDTKGNENRRFNTDELIYIRGIIEKVETEPIALMYADIGRDKSIVQEENRSSDALVLVETAPGERGLIAHKSTAFNELVDARSNRVRREYRDEFPPPGVRVIEEGRSTDGGKCYLLRMMPRSSFRIERTGVLQGAPNVLTVVWRGKSVEGASPLQVYSPQMHAAP